jgi:hypothetical protein
LPIRSTGGARFYSAPLGQVTDWIAPVADTAAMRPNRGSAKSNRVRDERLARDMMRSMLKPGTLLAAASSVALLAMGGCGGGAKTGTDGGADHGAAGGAGAARAACYPPCLANLVERCPLVSACTDNVEPNVQVGGPGESPGVAACFSTGEKVRSAATADHDLIYVKAPDGTDCYAAAGDRGAAVETWELSVGDQPVGTLTRNTTTGAMAVSCDGATARIDVTQSACQGLPWKSITACDVGQDCSLAQTRPPETVDAAPPCDPTMCTTPPAASCEFGQVSRIFVASYDGAPSCDTTNGCKYPKALTRCDHGCYKATCTAALASIANVQATATDALGTVTPVSPMGGTAPANTAVTVTARTSPRGACAGMDLDYGKCTAGTLCVMAYTLFMDPDPSTPADQTDYDQWRAKVPAQPAGTKIEFQLQATGAGDLSSMISQRSLGVRWSYTSN